MKAECEVVRDLMPLYIDGVCSTESRALVEEHLSGCDACREMCGRMRGGEGAGSESLDAQAVLERTSRTIVERTALTCAGILAIIVIWIVYIMMERLASLGDYSLFSYSVHEASSLALLFTTLATLVWLIAAAIRACKRRGWLRRAPLLAVLAVLLVLQCTFFTAKKNTLTTGATVLDVPDDTHIVVELYGGDVLTVETIPLVTGMIEEGGRYSVGLERTSLSQRVSLWYIERLD